MMGDTFRPSYITRREYAELDADLILDGVTVNKAKMGGVEGIKALTQFAMNPMENMTDGRKCTMHFNVPVMKSTVNEIVSYIVQRRTYNHS